MLWFPRYIFILAQNVFINKILGHYVWYELQVIFYWQDDDSDKKVKQFKTTKHNVRAWYSASLVPYSVSLGRISVTTFFFKSMQRDTGITEWTSSLPYHLYTTYNKK